jgi:Arc/MetJ-type ribon-helix-helix transcriptional regulator
MVMRMQVVSGVRLPDIERQRVEKLVRMGYYLNPADFLRDAVRSKLEEFEFAFTRKASLDTAKKEVLRLVKKQPNLYADEIAAKLNLDVETVIAAIDALIKEKRVTA